MGKELGRISGPLLAENLLRNGNDLAFETSLLYLDVNNQTININLAGPRSGAALYTPTKIDTNIINVSGASTIGAFTISGNTIQDINNASLIIRPNGGGVINAPAVASSLVTIKNDNTITNATSGSDINISPTGTGAITLSATKVNVTGTVHATGNIKLAYGSGGNVAFGSNNADNIVFNADVNSDIVPNINNTYNLGSSSFTWATLNSQNVNVTNLNTTNLTAHGVNLIQQPGGTIYVSINGSDSAIGKHPHAPVRSLKYALSIATSGDEIVIFPGTYTEVFPLTVPQGVTVKGMDIRAVTIQPTVGTNTQPAFYLHGDTTVEFLTVTGFYSNYAFRLAANYKATTKSPYIQNVTVITKGSVTSGTDPRGFNQGDAGGGAYIDGSVADPTGTIIPTMLFFSVTMIIPNANGVVLTNGSRAEWLNSFTYYAQRGIYLLRGTAGRFNQGTVFDTELRSINSANIYGTYGAVADGLKTLAYLIGHNFAYVGSGADTSNDPSLAVPANETVRLNSGVIYYESDDQSGNLKIGTVFSVNQATGVVSFNTNTLNLGSAGTISLVGPNGSTYIDKTQVEQSNIKIAGNTISSLAGDVNWLAYSGKTYLNTNVAITGNLSVTGDANIKGSMINFGNQTSDLVQIADQLTQSIYPNATNAFELGAAYFTTDIAADWLKVVVGNPATTIPNLSTILNTVLPSGYKLGDLNQDGSISATDVLQIQNYQANGTSGNTAIDVRIRSAFATIATYTATLGVASWAPIRWNNLDLSTNLNVNGVMQLGNYTATTLTTNTNLVLSANGTGIISVPTNNVTVQNNLTVNGATQLKDTGVTGTLNINNTYGLTGNWNQTPTGNLFVTGTLINQSNILQTNLAKYTQVGNVKFLGNTVSTTNTNGNLTLSGTGPAGPGITYNVSTNWNWANWNGFPSYELYGFSSDATFMTAVHALQAGDIITINGTDSRTVDHIQADSPIGYFHIYVVESSSMTVNSITFPGTTGLPGTVQLSGLKFNNNNITSTNAAPTVYTLLDYASAYISYQGGLYGQIVFVTPLSSALSTVILSYPVGTKIIGVSSGNGNFTRTITSKFQYIGGNYIANTQEFTATSYSFNSVSFFNETNNITFSPNGTGNTIVNSTTFLKLPIGNDTTKQLLANGEVRFNDVSGFVESFSSSGYVNWMNLWSQDRLTYITPELTPNASDDIFRFAVNNTVTTTLDATKLLNTNLIAGEVKINNNIIRNVDINSDITLASNGFGLVRFNGGAYVDGSKFMNPSLNQFEFQQTGNGYVKFAGDSGMVIPIGSSADRNPNAQGGELRYNSDSGLTEIFDPINLTWVPVYGNQSSVSESYVQDEVLMYTIVLGGL